jgi:hypothetical protein
VYFPVAASKNSFGASNDGCYSFLTHCDIQLWWSTRRKRISSLTLTFSVCAAHPLISHSLTNFADTNFSSSHVGTAPKLVSIDGGELQVRLS